LRALEDLKAQEKTMYELDHRKDQVMTVCKVALANLAMWIRDRYFQLSYAQATWKRLLPFFQLPGTITQDSTIVQVELCSFNEIHDSKARPRLAYQSPVRSDRQGVMASVAL
jgi:hypothetical protein